MAAGKSPSTARTARAGVRASIRATKGRNGSGAKGRRKVDEELRRIGDTPTAQCLRAKPHVGSTRHRWSRAPELSELIKVMTLCGGRSLSPILRCLLLGFGGIFITPLGGKTTNWRAGCGRSACPVRREGGPNSIGSPYPYHPTERLFHHPASLNVAPPFRATHARLKPGATSQTRTPPARR